MNKYFLSFLLAPVLILSTGCDKIPALEGNWLVGTWVLDREATMAAFTRNNQRESPVGGIVGEFAAAGIRKSVEAMISPLEKFKLVFTDNEFVEYTEGYVGKPKSYEIVSRPASNQMKILDSNNDVTIYHRVPETGRIWFNLKGNEKMQVYLKPAAQ